MSGNQRQTVAGTKRLFACSDARHDEAVLQAEVKRLVRALAPYGVLRRDVLRRDTSALGTGTNGGSSARSTPP